MMPITITMTPQAATVRIGDTQTFTPTVTGNANTSVTWTVNGVAGGSATVGTINAQGLYTPPATMPGNPTIALVATTVATPSVSAQSTITLANALPAPVSLSDARFLEQAMGAPRGREAGARYLRQFVEEMKASGFVGGALERSGQGDAMVAPPSPIR